MHVIVDTLLQEQVAVELAHLHMVTQFVLFVIVRCRSFYMRHGYISGIGRAEEAAQDRVVIDAGRAAEVEFQRRTLGIDIRGVIVDSQGQVEGVCHKPDGSGGLDSITKVLGYLYRVVARGSASRKDADRRPRCQ